MAANTPAMINRRVFPMTPPSPSPNEADLHILAHAVQGGFGTTPWDGMRPCPLALGNQPRTKDKK